MNAIYPELVTDLVAQVPGFEEVYETHLDDNGSVLPHVIFWDITQEIVTSYLRDEPDPAKWRAALDFLERRFLRDITEVNQVIVTSFLDSLPFAGEPGHGIVDQLGPALTKRYQLIRPHG